MTFSFCWGDLCFSVIMSWCWNEWSFTNLYLNMSQSWHFCRRTMLSFPPVSHAHHFANSWSRWDDMSAPEKKKKNCLERSEGTVLVASRIPNRNGQCFFCSFWKTSRHFGRKKNVLKKVQRFNWCVCFNCFLVMFCSEGQIPSMNLPGSLKPT